MSYANAASGQVVLLIDDDPIFTAQMSAVLDKFEFKVITASNGKAALPLLENHQVDLILCDLLMPVLDGIGFLKQFRKHNKTTPVVMISASDDIYQVDQALKLGAIDYLIKPIRHIQDFMTTLKSFFPAFESEQERQIGGMQSDLMEHLGYFRANDLAASRLLSDFLPETPQTIANYHIHYRRCGAHIVPEILLLNEAQCCLFVFDLSALGKDAAVAGVIVKSLINEAYRRYTQGQDEVISLPDKFCASLNRQLWRAKLNAPIPFFQLVISKKERVYANAGFTEVSGCLKNEVATGMALGVSESTSYSKKQLKCSESLLAFSLENLAGEQLHLKIQQVSKT